ncbi:MAG: hypothetical protein JWP91_3957 [Fibrobacteres bacterium]|nr:hypothetical protein [Fibrobacterota bacterium]
MKKLKDAPGMPIPCNGMAPFHPPIGRMARILGLAALFAWVGSAEAAKKKSKPVIPLVTPAPKADASAAAPAKTGLSGDAGGSGTTFAEINFNRTLVIEGKVEKPAVQFTLLKEPPPEKEIRFETSFLQNILKLDRENTFKAGETYGRE